ncbi:MAG: sigma 54-interacting transcriptional regulator [Ignavibacteriales bacterium]
MSHIAVICPDSDLASLCKEAVRAAPGGNVEIRIRVAGRLDLAVETAKTEYSAGAEVIISRGGTAHVIRSASLPAPVIEISVTALDLLFAIHSACDSAGRIVVVGFPNVTRNLEGAEAIVSERMRVAVTLLRVDSHEEIRSKMKQIVNTSGGSGLAFIGGSLVVETAVELGCKGVLLRSSAANVTRALEEAVTLVRAVQIESNRASLQTAILNSISDGVIATDSSGRITSINKSAESILGARAANAAGANLPAILPEFGDAFSGIMQSGKPETDLVTTLGSRTVVVNYVPLKQGSQPSGTLITLKDVTEVQMLEQAVRKKLASGGLVAKYTFGDIVARGARMRETLSLARRFGRTERTVLILGETGTGKELFAHAIHNESPRHHGPFVSINCSALPENLLESELFGYEEGAFTGARKGGKPGMFELAHAGTIFLDEIGAIPARLQMSLLRVLQEREIMRVGGSRVMPVDVRVIAATNARLEELVWANEFRADLYYRLNVLTLRVPPLRDRKEDIQALILHFLRKSLGRGIDMGAVLPDRCLPLLVDYPWPGNVRQLENVVERLCTMYEGKPLRETQVRTALDNQPGPPPVLEREGLGRLESRVLDTAEKMLIAKVLQDVNGNKTEAARRLGISTTTLWRRLKAMNR